MNENKNVKDVKFNNMKEVTVDFMIQHHGKDVPQEILDNIAENARMELTGFKNTGYFEDTHLFKVLEKRLPDVLIYEKVYKEGRYAGKQFNYEKTMDAIGEKIKNPFLAWFNTDGSVNIATKIDEYFVIERPKNAFGHTNEVWVIKTYKEPSYSGLDVFAKRELALKGFSRDDNKDKVFKRQEHSELGENYKTNASDAERKQIFDRIKQDYTTEKNETLKRVKEEYGIQLDNIKKELSETISKRNELRSEKQSLIDKLYAEIKQSNRDLVPELISLRNELIAEKKQITIQKNQFLDETYAEVTEINNNKKLLLEEKHKLNAEKRQLNNEIIAYKDASKQTDNIKDFDENKEKIKIEFLSKSSRVTEIQGKIKELVSKIDASEIEMQVKRNEIQSNPKFNEKFNSFKNQLNKQAEKIDNISSNIDKIYKDDLKLDLFQVPSNEDKVVSIYVIINALSSENYKKLLDMTLLSDYENEIKDYASTFIELQDKIEALKVEKDKIFISREKELDEIKNNYGKYREEHNINTKPEDTEVETPTPVVETQPDAKINKISEIKNEIKNVYQSNISDSERNSKLSTLYADLYNEVKSSGQKLDNITGYIKFLGEQIKADDPSTLEKFRTIVNDAIDYISKNTEISDETKVKLYKKIEDLRDEYDPSDKKPDKFE